MPKRAELISSGVLLAFGLLLVFFIIPNQIGLPDYEVTMSPRLLPYICAIGIIVLSGSQIIQHLLARHRDSGVPFKGWFTAAEGKALVGIAGLFIICIALFIHAAPIVAGGVLVVGLLALFGERNILIYVALPTALLLATYLIFYQVLGTAIG